MTGEEPEYKLGKGTIGYGYDVQIDAKGRIIDGFNRLDADPDWPRRVREDIDTDRKLFAARIELNANRRSVGGQELAEWVNRLAEEILKESDGLVDNMARKISQETNMAEKKVRRHLNPIYKVAEAALAKDGAKAEIPQELADHRQVPDESVEQEPPLHEEEVDEGPQKGTQRFAWAVNETITKRVGQPIPTIMRTVRTAFSLSEKEAQDHINAFKVEFPDIWYRVYDSNEELLPRAKAPEEPSRSPVVFERDYLLERAEEFYPTVIIENIWDAIPTTSEKITFVKSLIAYMYQQTILIVSKKELFDAVLLSLS